MGSNISKLPNLYDIPNICRILNILKHRHYLINMATKCKYVVQNILPSHALDNFYFVVVTDFVSIIYWRVYYLNCKLVTFVIAFECSIFISPRQNKLFNCFIYF